MSASEHGESLPAPTYEHGGGSDLLLEALSALEDHIAVLDRQGTIIAVNASWRSFALTNGASPSCVNGVGLNYLDVCDAAQGAPHDLALIRSCRDGIQNVLQGTVPKFQAEYACDSPTERRCFRVRITPLGAHQGAVVVHENITKQRETEQALHELMQSKIRLESELQGIVDSLPAMVGYWDKSLHNRFANNAYRTWFGKTPDQIRGQHIRSLLGDKIYTANLPYIQGVLRGETQRFEREIPSPGGTIRSSQTVYTPHVVDGEVVGFSVLVSDVTELKRTEVLLREAKAAADQAARAKGLFLANISHELRTPMGGIMGMANLALRTQLTAEQHEYLEAIQQSATTLLVLLNDLLDFEKIEAGQLQIAKLPFSLRELVEGTVTALAPAVYDKGLELALRIAPDVPDALHGDPTRIRQVLTNLIGNALKFTLIGEISVHVVAEPVAAAIHTRRIRVTVCDTGIGIAPEQRERIFQPFSQGDESVTRRFGGTGLGLSICSRLAHLMNGKVWVDSELGRGSHFHVTFEVGVDAVQPARPKASGRLRGSSVLLVDSHETSRKNLGELLSSFELQPTVAQDVSTARSALANTTQSFELAVIQAKAAEPDGIALIEELRRTTRFQGRIVLLVPAGSITALSDRHRSLGICSILHKPVGEAKLLTALSSAREEKSTALSSATEPLRARVSRNVLLVEDNAINRQIGKMVLEKRGHRVVMAETGKEALEHLEREHFDVVLMDLQMPEMGGLEATQLIRAREAQLGGHIRIAAVTAHAMAGDKGRCREAGMDGYLSKPLNFAELYAFVEG